MRSISGAARNANVTAKGIRRLSFGEAETQYLTAEGGEA
jgi:hypothetical protein